MSLNNKTKSILLQVAFKAAAQQEFADNTELMRKSADFYDVLLALHEKYDVADQSTGGGSDSGGSTATVPDAPTVTIDGVEYFDYRGLKEIGDIENPMFPDFKAVSDGKGFWLTKKDGSPTKFAQTVATAGV